MALAPERVFSGLLSFRPSMQDMSLSLNIYWFLSNVSQSQGKLSHLNGGPSIYTVMIDKILMTIASLSGFSAVLLGALAAHALKSRLAPDALANVETASRYLFVHALLLALVSLLLRAEGDSMTLKAIGIAAVTGIFLFAGGLATSALTGTKLFAAGAPFGGLALMAAWLGLGVYALSRW